MTALLEVSGVSVTFDGFRAINNLSFSHDARLLASASSDGTAKIWHTGTASPPITFSAGASGLWCVAISHDQSRLAAAADGGRVHIWDVARRLPVARLQQPNPSIALRLTFGPDDSWLGAAGNGWHHIWPAPHNEAAPRPTGEVHTPAGQ